MRDPRLPSSKPPRHPFDPPRHPGLDMLLLHKGSPVPLEPVRRPMPWPQRPEYQRGPNFPTLATDPLRPLYTEKVEQTVAFPTLALAAQRRRDFWSKIVARGGIAMMVAAPVLAIWKGGGFFPAGAFVAGLIIFAATCFVGGSCNKTRLL